MNEIFKWAKQHAHQFSTINAIATITLAALGTVAAIYDVWFAGSQNLPIPALHATTVSTLRGQVIDRRTALQSEIRDLDALIEDLDRAAAALAGSPIPEPLDPLWQTALKTPAVLFLLYFSALVSVPALLIDVVSLPFGYSFPLLRAIWGWSWTTVTVGWYWQYASPLGIVIGSLLVLVPGAITTIVDARRRRSGDTEASTGNPSP
jgi:hypothetical protein